MPRKANLNTGETALILGISGTIGEAVGELAKSSLFGCRVITAGRGGRFDIGTISDSALKTSGRVERQQGHRCHD
jgi:NADPH-dependent curcumin reductase CurA